MFETIALGDGRVLEYVDLGDPDGAPVVLFHGTPGTAGLAALVAESARARQVRLVAPSRPGYGASTPSPPGLTSGAGDAVELADRLGLGEVGVVGISGGGPFALALGVVAPTRVTSVVVHAGTGPYFEVMPPTDEDAAERAAMALFATGDVDAAIAALTASADSDFGPLRALSDDDFREAITAMAPPGENWLERHPPADELFDQDFRRAMATSAGYVRDVLSWGGAWDVELSQLTRPVRLVRGETDRMVPPPHTEWLAARLPDAELVVVHGGHGDASFGQADETFALLAAQRTT